MRIVLGAALAACRAGHGADSTNTAPNARVLIASDPSATANFIPDDSVVRRLFDRALLRWSEKPSLAEAWRTLVMPEEMVGIKVVTGPGPSSGTKPAVIQAVVGSLIESGHPPQRIVLWDKHLADLESGGYAALAARLGIRCAGAVESDWDSEKFYETSLIGRPVYGDKEFNQKGDKIGRKSYLTRLLVNDVAKIISIAPLLNHNHGGVHGHLVSLALGSVDNSLRFEGITERLAEAVPEIYAMPEISEHVVLNVTDALLCQYRGEERALLHYATALNELRLSRDPVALDLLSLMEIEKARKSNPTAGDKPIRRDLIVNAGLLELGVSDTNRIQVVR